MTTKKDPKNKTKRKTADLKAQQPEPEPWRKVRDMLSRRMRNQTIEETLKEAKEARKWFEEEMAKRDGTMPSISTNLRNGKTVLYQKKVKKKNTES